jgi:hypothetical protein
MPWYTAHPATQAALAPVDHADMFRDIWDKVNGKGAGPSVCGDSCHTGGRIAYRTSAETTFGGRLRIQ